MKHLFLLVLTFICANAFATIRTVSNNPSTIAQFNTIQAAIDASSDGDTLFVHGSPNIYAASTITDKRLVLIGPGWSPDKHIPLQAQVNTVNIRNSASAGTPSGSEFQGLLFTAAVNILFQTSGDLPVNNLTFRRCQFNASLNFGSFDVTDLLVEGCVFYNSVTFGGSTRTCTNILFQNNLFFFSVCCLSNQFSGLDNSVNVRFDHNLFYSSDNGGSTVSVFSGNNRFMTFSNNIFNEANVGLGVSSSTFTNNITNNSTLAAANATSNATPWNVNGNVDGGGNVSNQSPQMTQQAQVDAGNGSPVLDFTIPAGPANNSAADGKDMGLLFDATGSLNWANSRNSRLPRIFSMNITTPTVAPGGNLSVTVEARKSN